MRNSEEHCEQSRAFLTKKAKLVAENVELSKIVQKQDEVLADMHEMTEKIKRKTAERRVELEARRAGQRARENAPRPG